MAALRNAYGMVCGVNAQWEARLARPRGSTTSRLDFAVAVDGYVLRQPVEHVGSMPADRLSTVRALLRESSEDRESEKQPARATGQA